MPVIRLPMQLLRILAVCGATLSLAPRAGAAETKALATSHLIYLPCAVVLRRQPDNIVIRSWPTILSAVHLRLLQLSIRFIHSTRRADTMRILRPCLVALLSLVSIVAAAGAPRSAQTATTCPVGGCRQYLPLLNYQVAPALVAPANAEQLTTLAPPLIWRPTVIGQHKIEVSVDPEFSGLFPLDLNTTKQVKLPLPQTIQTQMTSNLKFGITYFWRVGVVLPEGVVYSPVQSFTTPAEGSIQLPGLVTVITPRNNSHLTGNRVELKWVAISGALLYRIRMFDAAGNAFDPGTVQLAGDKTRYLVENVPSGTYTWKIKVYTAVGWGPYPSDDYTFSMY